MNLVFLAALVAACQAAKLDRTYLPPPSSKFAGGPPGFLQAPFITGVNRNRPGFFLTPFVRTSDNNPSQGNIPPGSYVNENEGVVVEAAAPGTRASNQPSGLGGPRVNYGSTDSKVGDAAFRGTKNQPGPNTNGAFQTQIQFGSPQSQGSFGANNKNQDNLDLSAFHQPTGQVNAGFRPGNQLSRDRVSNIIKYHNKVGLKKFNYGFETENGIKMEQNGVSDNGIHTQGGYSYTGDDGKVYSVVYTADKDGYRPMGAHLPTSPPIPEEILEALKQNARDEANGLYDDGSYDAQKYNAEDDYTQSDTNGNNNDRQSNKFEKRPGFDAGASINQQQQGFVRPNVQGQFAYDFTNTDTTKLGTGGIGFGKPQNVFNAQLHNKFGSQFQYLPPFGNTQESKPLQDIDVTSSQENQNNRPQNQNLSFQTNLQSSDKNKNEESFKPDLSNRFTSQLPTLTPIAQSVAPTKEYETEKNTFNVNSITQASISPFPSISSTSSSQTHSGEVYEYPKPDQGFPGASQENQGSSLPTTAQDYDTKPQINGQPNTQFGQNFPTTSNSLFGQSQPQVALQGSSAFGQSSTLSPVDSLSFNRKTTPSSSDAQPSTLANQETGSSFEQQQTQTSFGYGQQTTPTHFDSFKKACGVCSTFGHKTRPQSGTQNSFSNSQTTQSGQIPTLSPFGTSLNQKTTSTRFGAQAMSFGQKPTQPQSQTSYSFGSQKTPSRFGVQTGLSDQKITTSTFGTSSFTKQQTKPTFGVQTSSTFEQKPTQTFGVQIGSTSGQQTTPTLSKQTSSTFGQNPTQTFGVQTGSTLEQQTTPTFGVETSSAFEQKPTQTFVVQTGSSLGEQTTATVGEQITTTSGQKPTQTFGAQTGSTLEQQTTPMFGEQIISTFGQKPTQTFGVQTGFTLGQQTTPTFGVETDSTFGQKPTQTFDVQTGSTFGQQTTPTFGEQTTSTFRQKPTQTFGVQTGSILSQQTTPTFGEQTSSRFGQNPTQTFGVQTGSTLEQQTTPTFGEQATSTFGHKPTQTFGVQTDPTLGQQTTPTFGVETSSTFGHKPTQTFGVQTGSTLGQQTTPTFGEQATSTFGQKPTQTFGLQTGSTQTTPTFGEQATSTFGQKPTQTFGLQTGSTFGQQTTPTFGEQSSSTFGHKPTQTFGVQTGSTLGQQTTPTFGEQATSTFGQKPTQTFGLQTGSTFGQQTTPTFGEQTTSTFGQQPTQTFGVQTDSTLGQQTTPTFIEQTSSKFGQKPTQTFGVQTGSTLGQQTTPTFGEQITSTFGPKQTQIFGVQTGSTLAQQTTPSFDVQTSSTFGHATSTQFDGASSEEQSAIPFGITKPEQSQSQESNELSEPQTDSKLSTLHSTISDSQSSKESIETTNSNEIYQYNKPSTAFPVNTQILTSESEKSQGTQYAQQPVTLSDAQSFSTSRKEYASQPNLQSQEEIFPPFPEQQAATNSPFTVTQFGSTISIDQGFDTKETTQFSSNSQSESTRYQPSTDPALSTEIQKTQSQQSGEVYEYNKPVADSAIENNVFGQKKTQAEFTVQPNQNKLDITKPIAAHLSQNTEKLDNGILTTQSPVDYAQTGSTPSLKPVNSFYSACCQGNKTQNTKDVESSSEKIQSDTLNVTANVEGISNESGLNDKFGYQDSDTTGISGLGVQKDTPIKGEDFGGPRKPPTFDETGYHY